MPDVLTRVSEFIQPIIVYIQKIIARGLAYESNGSVCANIFARSPCVCSSKPCLLQLFLHQRLQQDALLRQVLPLLRGQRGTRHTPASQPTISYMFHLTSPQALLEDGEGALSEGSEKRDKSDFALWKVPPPQALMFNPRTLMLFGRRARPGSPSGTAPGAKAGPAGTSSAGRARSSFR